MLHAQGFDVDIPAKDESLEALLPGQRTDKRCWDLSV